MRSVLVYQGTELQSIHNPLLYPLPFTVLASFAQQVYENYQGLRSEMHLLEPSTKTRDS